MAEGNIRFKLDLVLHLLDTTTGLPITRQIPYLEVNGRPLTMQRRGDGTYILLNRERLDMDIALSLEGYYPMTILVRYEELDERYPEIEVPLIPIRRSYGFNDICTLEGNMKGITDIAAISIHRTDAMLGAYDAKKNILRLFETRRLDEDQYAIFHKGKMEFEEFRIVKQSDRGMLLHLKEPLLQECEPEESIVRIVRGMTDTKGRYLLCVRNDGNGTKYLIRYTVRGKTKFQLVEFGDQEERRLE